MFNTYNTHRATHPLAEYISQKSMSGAYFDEDAVTPDGYYGRVGRRVFFADTYGFLSVTAYSTPKEASNAIMWSVDIFGGDDWIDESEVDYGF